MWTLIIVVKMGAVTAGPAMIALPGYQTKAGCEQAAAFGEIPGAFDRVVAWCIPGPMNRDIQGR